MANLPRTIKTVWAVLLMAALFSITAFAANPFTSNSTIVQQDKENRTTNVVRSSLFQHTQHALIVGAVQQAFDLRTLGFVFL